MAAREIRTKLKSGRGVSVLMALLYFLVCVSIGSVVLTAGTAAAGRYAELAKSDQRYYGVTSAARLLRTLIGDETIKVHLTKDVTDVVNASTGVTTQNISYDISDVNGGADSIMRPLQGGEALTQQAVSALADTIFGNSAPADGRDPQDVLDSVGWASPPLPSSAPSTVTTWEAFGDDDDAWTGQWESFQANITPTTGGTAISSGVKVSYRIRKDGMIAFQVTNKTDPDSTDPEFRISFECPISVTALESANEKELTFAWRPGQITIGE